MKIYNTFCKYISNINNENDARQNYLSIKILWNLLVTFFAEETRYLSIIFSNSEFGMRVHKGKIQARNESISLYTFLRISPRKIIILKKTKLNPRELNELDGMNVKKALLNLMNILESTTKISKR